MRILINTRTPWDEPPRARHQLAGALARRHPVLFVAANTTGPPGIRRIEAAPNLTVLIPSFPVHQRLRYRFPALNEIYQRWLFSRLPPGFHATHAINFDHTATQLCRYFPNAVYYCNDFHIRNFGIAPIRRYLEACERAVVRRSAFSIGTCEYLCRRLARWNPNTHEIRLGAPVTPSPPPPPRGGPTIRIALVAFLSEQRIPAAILEALAAQPNVEMDIYGPLKPSEFVRLRQRPNVRCHGVLTGEPLLAALRDSDLGIAPYAAGDNNPGRTPNKLWLYLAAGLPCIMTRLPATADWSFPEGFLYPASTPDEFCAAVRRAHAENTAGLALARHQFSQRNTWDQRADQLLGLLA